MCLKVNGRCLFASLAAFWCLAALADRCEWKAGGWAKFADAANWAGGKVPTPADSVKPGPMLFDLGGGNAAVREMKPSGWEDIYDFGVSNGSLTVREYVSRSNRVRVERGGALVFARPGSWAGGEGMGSDRWERVAVLAGGRMELLGAFKPWHADIDIAPGGTLVLAPSSARFGDSFFPSTVTNRGTLLIPNRCYR